MKALFYCRTERTKLMVHLAKSMQKSGSLTSAHAFVAYYDEWRQYLKSQEHVKFSTISGTREIFQRMGRRRINSRILDRLEKDYGSVENELYNMLYAESFIATHTHSRICNHPQYSRDDMLLLMQESFLFFEDLFDRIKPDVIIDFAVASMIRSIIHVVAKKRGIPYLIPHSAIMKNRHIIGHGIKLHVQGLDETYNDLLETGARCRNGEEYFKWFHDKKTRSACSVNLKDKSKPSRLRLVTGQLMKLPRYTGREIHLRLAARKNAQLRYNFQLYKNLPSVRFRRMMSSAWTRMRLGFRTQRQPKKYVLMTLHVQPEASTSVLSPFFVNQLYVIDMVCRALPLGWILLVKPNPNMIGIEKPSFYKQISAIPNAELAAPNSDTMRLIRSSKAVLTITGTSGFEGALLNRPVVALSNAPIWTIIRGVRVVTDPTLLHETFTQISPIAKRDVVAYLQALHDRSFGLDCDYIWDGPYDLADKGYSKAIDIIAENITKSYGELKDA